MNKTGSGIEIERNECCSTDTVQNKTTSAFTQRQSMGNKIKEYIPAIISGLLLAIGLILKHALKATFFSGTVEIIWYAAAYIPVAVPVLKHAWKTLLKGEIFTEFLLMSIATIGAFAIGEYPEGVAVMLFYTVGELFQGNAVRKAKMNIAKILDVRPNTASVLRSGSYIEVHPQEVEPGEKVRVRAGEKVPLDAKLTSENAQVNTSALTGESLPRTLFKGDPVLAGFVNTGSVIEMETTRGFEDSSIARMLELIQHAASRKAKTELLIRRLAKVYTPIVVFAALAICFVPYLAVDNYEFSTWLYRALIFLVISCPCALVISIPLGYFGGLGAASRNGLLFKGAVYMDQVADISILAFDKTGTVTRGVFEITDIICKNGISEIELLSNLKALEAQSNHPIAKAIMDYESETPTAEALEVHEIPGQGIEGIVNDTRVLAGNKIMMDRHDIQVEEEGEEITGALVHVAIGGVYAGSVLISDEIKPDAKQLISALRKAGIRSFAMLSGDRDIITQRVAGSLGIDYAKGDLLPEGKLNEIERLKNLSTGPVAFMGDGINDAAVLTASDIGIAMGAMGSDIAIESADVVIQSDKPSKILKGIEIARLTKRVIWQNIAMAIGVKVIVLVLGAIGMASMWAAVFADVGVALLAILNAIRIQWKIKSED